MHMHPLQFIIDENSSKKINIVSDFIQDKERVLDFGCGDLSFTNLLWKKNKSLDITAIDVVDFKKRVKGIKFVRYNGEKLPFPDNTFDTVISYYVLHHTNNALKYFEELIRVSKKRIILVESVARHPIEFPGMKFMDWVFNIWKPESIALTYQFKTYDEWKNLFEKHKLKIISDIDVEIMPIPKFFPVGRSHRFILEKK